MSGKETNLNSLSSAQMVLLRSSAGFCLFLLLRSSVSNGRPYCYCIVSFSLFFLFFCSYRFCAEDFSKSVGTIFMKFSGLIDNHKNLITFFYFDDVTSGFAKSQIFSILEGLVVQTFPPKL